MTSEVIIMNRNAIALAADSAITSTSATDVGGITRYFKGANKLFELSNHEPVAIMYYGNADLNGIPWDVIIKEFRDGLAQKAFNSMHEYGCEFFKFIEANVGIIPEIEEEIDMVAQTGTVARHLCETIYNDQRVKITNINNLQSEQMIVFNEIFASTMSFPVSLHFSTTKFTDFLKAHTHSIINTATALINKYRLMISSLDIANLIIERIRRCYFNVLPQTGIVVAGFGKNDYLPSFINFKCFGKFLGKVVYDTDDTNILKRKGVGGSLEAFAQGSMTHTFALGVGSEMANAIHNGVKTALCNLSSAIESTSGKITNIDNMIETELQGFQKSFQQIKIDTHYHPLLRVISSLPINEMAALAETLVSLEALKEKFSKPSESVGGPIDVAIITRSEGLVWIRRKHFFHADFNVKFLERQRQRMSIV